MTQDSEVPSWSEDDSSTFLDTGRFFVPRREEQIEALCRLVPVREGAFEMLELCPGEGLLAESLLRRFPRARLLALDGSEAMRRRCRQRLAPFGDRVRVEGFRLEGADWRRPEGAFRAVVSSLAVHHLDGPGKRQLFADVHRLLEPGGALLLADLVEPASEPSRRYAAQVWDEEVARRSQKTLGDLSAVERFQQEKWNLYRHPDPVDQPSGLLEQLRWLQEAGFQGVDVFWLLAGHAVYGGFKSP
jgi:cyclopropane fatty-acyl-phospholipid synthase-like methyltransferase